MLYADYSGVADFAKLRVWRSAHALALNVYRVAGQIRGPMNGALRNQMVRASMSIPANIVEGRGQKSGAEFARFLRYAINSSSELEYHVTMARDVHAISASDHSSLLIQLTDVRKMLYGLSKRVTSPPAPTRQP